MSTEKRRRLNVEQAITGSDGSPTFRKNRRAQPIERDLDGIPDDNPNGPPSLAECEDIVEGALQQHSDVFNPTPEITAHHLLSTVVSAVRSNGGSVGECCVAADIFAYMFSSQSLFDIGQYLKEHRMWTTVARARRATISSGQAAGNKHPWTAGTPATYNVQYNSFLDIVDLVMSFGVPHSQSSLLRMYTCMETYQKFDNMGHGLADDGDLAKSMSERAQQHGLSGFGDTAAHGPAADGFLNAAIDYIGSGRAEDEFHSFRHLLQELLYIGSGLTSIASWGDGALMCLLHSEWCMNLTKIRRASIEAAQSAASALDPDVVGMFRPLSEAVRSRLLPKEFLHQSFVLEQYTTTEFDIEGALAMSYSQLLAPVTDSEAIPT